MAATDNYMHVKGSSAQMVPPTREISVATLVRGFTRLIAVALLASALGIWIAPGASNIAEIMLMKLCASFFLGVTGLHLLFAARTPHAPT
ncbi:hypothetical protein PGB28_00325 [Primorskyibacter aestuariivivens]|uniref:hypothetical protein n=1 Tax=Primorskyibacter aestuariivivens TaxID=1888912 RepID=UPI0022FFFDF3|nr:hypothetical protein [Primorskyibacter aestuariivivens]MDA7426884.1 hypothetical protein [Primorskyibacter aestuariivivens]